MFDLQTLLDFLASLSHYPTLVYLTVILILTASSFGLPIPEEVTLIAAGTISYFALHSPRPDDVALVNPWMMASICFLAVFLSDFLVYWLGLKSKGHLHKFSFLAKLMNTQSFQKTESLVKTHGHWMAGVFRFTPGLRFPGHFSCGALGVPWSKFVLVDGSAALLTVPTQVLFVAYYGDAIIAYFKQFKILLVSVIAITLIVFVVRHYLQRRASKKIAL